MNRPAVVEISLLGPWQMIGGPAKEPRRKEQGLLAYLAVEANQSHSRDSLVGLFWPDMPAADARNNLRVALSRLKRHLGNSSSLESTRHTIRFTPNSQIQLDVNQFQELISCTEKHEHASLSACQSCQDCLKQAVELYRGEFLAGFYLDDCLAFEEWLFVWRERLHVQMTNLLEELSHFYTQTGNFTAAEKYTRRQLELDSLQEKAHCQLMRLLIYQGQRSAALAQFQACRHILQEELGVEPSADTILLYQQVKDDAVEWPQSQVKAQASDTPTPQLPTSLTPFIGRETELAQLGERLGQKTYRLITVVGPGGIGKTRLALQAALENQHHFPDGVYFVSLAPVTKAADMVTAVAETIGLTLTGSSETPHQQLSQYLQNRGLLLVLDNLEHLMDGLDFLLDILANAPNVTLLVTSRERLNLQAEDLFRLGGLPVPQPHQLDQAGQFAAVTLFCDRAYRLHKQFRLNTENMTAVVDICRAVEGLPLAIELATSWIRDFTVAELAAAIRSNLDILETTLQDVAPQHRSMRVVFDHSWQLLSGSEKELLARLSVFQGGFSHEAAAVVTNATPIQLTRLRYKSLIRHVRQGRYDIHELLCQFAAEKLGEQPDEKIAVHQKHSAYYVELLASLADKLQGAQPQLAVAKIQQELDNVRQAWQWALRHRCWSALATGLEGLAHFYLLTGLYAEEERRFTEVLDHLEHETDTAEIAPLRLKIQIELVDNLTRQSKLERALTLASQAVAQAEQCQDSYDTERAYLGWGYAYQQNGDAEAARHCFEQGLHLARQGEHVAVEGDILRHLGNLFIDRGDRKQGEAYLQQALSIQQMLGNRIQEQILWLYLGASRVEDDDYQAGRTYLEKARQLVQEIGNRAIESRIVNALGYVEAALGNLDAALSHHEQSRQISREIGEPFQESHALHNLCTVKRKLGDLTAAAAFGREALELGQAFHLPNAESYAWMHLGYVWLEMGLFDVAAQAFQQARTGWEAQERTVLAVECTAGLAEVVRQRGDHAEALAYTEQVLAFLADNTLAGADEPFQIYLTCYRVLQANSDHRADDLLGQMHQQLQTIANKIGDVELQYAFLHNIPTHQEIVQAWEQL